MKLNDYISGARHGREAHDLELESMGDPLLADALDGFDAVPGAPGEHSAALERLAQGVALSASGGRAAARARAARVRDKRVRGWSMAAAAVFLAAVAGGGTWLLRNGVRTDNSPTLANHTPSSGYPGEVVEILPPVTVIEEDVAREIPATEPAPTVPAPTDMPEMNLENHELPVMAEIVGLMADIEVIPEVIPETVAVQSLAARGARLSESALALAPAQAPALIESQAKIRAEAQAEAATEIPARDTTQTDVFRRHVADRNRVRSAVMGPVTISFEVDADGRPRGIEIVESPTPELGEFARSLLDEGPDWPAEPSQKLITLNL